jgi:hypothetical protein
LIAISAAIGRKPMRHGISCTLILAAVAPAAIVSARAASVAPAISRPANAIIAVECRPYNGPFGYYGDPWCNTGGDRKPGASSPKRSNREPAYKATNKPRPTKEVDTAKTTPAKTTPATKEAEVENENSSIARASLETDKTGEQTTVEAETKPTAEPAPTNTASCKRYFPSVGKTVSVACD